MLVLGGANGNRECLNELLAFDLVRREWKDLTKSEGYNPFKSKTIN